MKRGIFLVFLFGIFVFLISNVSGVLGPTFTSYTGCSDPSLDTGGKFCQEITSTSCPGVLSTANRYYLVMQDWTHTGGGHCISIDAQNITVDMNNHRIEYEQSSGNRNTIEMTSSADYSDIKNGIIEETTETYGAGGIATTIWCDYCRIHDMNITTRSFWSRIVYVRDIMQEARIDHSHINRATTEIFNTMSIYGMIESIEGMSVDARMYINDNIIDGRAVQIKWGHSETEIYNNLLRPTKRNRNPYAIRLHDFVNDADVYNNTFLSDTAQGMLVSNGDNLHVYNNFMNVTSESLASDGIQEGMGNALRMRERFRNSVFENNTVIFRIHPTNPFEGTACYFTTHPLLGTNIGVANTFINNTCIATTHDGNYRATAFATDEGTNMSLSVIDNNTFISNSAGIFLGITWMGDTVYNGGVDYLTMKSNTVEKLAGTPSITFNSLIMGNPGGEGLENNTIIDTHFINTDYSDRGYTTGSGLKEISIQWYLNVTVKDNGDPLYNAKIDFYNNSDNIAYTGYTNFNGVSFQPLEEFHDESISRIVTTYTQSPYTVNVTHPYTLDVISVPVTLDHSQSIEVNFYTSSNNPNVDMNGGIDIVDLAIVVFNYGQPVDGSGYDHLDIDGDSDIDFSDAQVVANLI